MYRDSLLAATSQVSALRARLEEAEARAQRLAQAKSEAEAMLVRVREGVEPDPALRDAPEYRALRWTLALFGVFALVVLMFAVVEVANRWMGDPLLTAQGVRNFIWSVEHGGGSEAIAATGFVAVMISPLLVLPALGFFGLGIQRRWGWSLAVLACSVFVLSPLVPFAGYGLSVLFSRRIRRIFVPSDTQANAVHSR